MKNALEKGYFDFEQLDAYRHVKAVMEFVALRRRKLMGLPGKSGEQLERACVGALTNVCSGASAFGAEQKRHFKIALTEASEAAGAVELARIYGAISTAEYDELREKLTRLCACLHGLIR